MLTAAENDRLTRVGPGTPMGALLRRYWHPVAALAEMDGRWTKSVRLLGEDLVLYRDRSGDLGLIGAQCPHRRASMAYGIPTEHGLRCPYHGWQFDATGTCVEQPNEPAGSTFHEKTPLPGYPVRAHAGLAFAYLGPAPAPQLPRFEGFAAAPAVRIIGTANVNCNWLQITENSVDPIHSEWLHGHLQEFVEERRGTRYTFSKRHLKIAFDEAPYGIVKRRLQEGQAEDCDDWRVGHPIVFPNVLALGNIGHHWRRFEYQIRVPVDDAHTRHVWHTTWVPLGATRIPEHLANAAASFEVPTRGPDGEYALDILDAQDLMAWETQGAIADRSVEHLAAQDRGLTLYRRMLAREMARVEAGEDPLCVEREAAAGPLVLPVETHKGHHSDGMANLFRRRHFRYAAIADELLALFASTEDAPAGVAR